MRLVDAAYITDEEREIASVLTAHPVVARYLVSRMRAYREIARLCLWDADSADIAKSVRRVEESLQRVGLTLADDEVKLP